MCRAFRIIAWSLLTTGLGIATSFAGKPPANSPTADLYLAPGTPPCSGLSEVTGIYQDGKGTYLPKDAVEFSQNGDLRVTPLCSVPRQFNVLLPATALAVLGAPFEACRGTGALLKIPALRDAPTGVVGQPSLPPDY